MLFVAVVMRREPCRAGVSLFFLLLCVPFYWVRFTSLFVVLVKLRNRKTTTGGGGTCVHLCRHPALFPVTSADGDATNGNDDGDNNNAQEPANNFQETKKKMKPL